MQKAFPNKLVGRPFAVSDLKFFEKEKDFRGGEFIHTEFIRNRGIVFQGKIDSPVKGSYVSPLVKSPFPMTELLPSWNVKVPETAGYSISIQITTDTLNFSPWLFLGREGEAPEPEAKNQSWNGATVDVDYILSDKPFTHYRWKIDFFRSDSQRSPELKLFSVCHGNSEGDEALFKKFSPKDIPHNDLIKKLDVPYRSQLADNPGVSERQRHSICCPVSVSMVLAYYKKSLSVREVRDLCFDPDSHIYGSWPRSTQTLYRFGLRSYVTQIRSFDEIKPFIARGIPVIISIKASEGELVSAPYKKTSGHILVIVGVDKNDAAWVNDPYNPDGKEGPRLWTRKEIETVHIGRGGVIIIAEPK
ncbi:C39 family peptidase [Candidatus Sumerlaeota bacterium]|nr:C39 family peptidase [Candidatus Sumerlaeota bacterium]